MRTYTVTVDQFRELGPHGVVEELKKHGFKFLSESCPIKFAPNFEQIVNADDSVTYKQWEN